MKKGKAMARLIDANRAKDFAEMCFSDKFLLTAVRTLLDKSPTVDAAEVVRCKNCKYYEPYTLTCKFSFDPCAPNPNWYHEDFCSYGERKDNET